MPLYVKKIMRTKRGRKADFLNRRGGKYQDSYKEGVGGLGRPLTLTQSTRMPVSDTML